MKEKEERRIGWSYFSIYGGIKDGIFQARYIIFYHIGKGRFQSASPGQEWSDWKTYTTSFQKRWNYSQIWGWDELK